MAPTTRSMTRMIPFIRLREPRLPTETWIEIFNYTFESAGDSYFSYNYARDIVCITCPEWDGIVKARPHFWRRLAIDCLTTPRIPLAVEYGRQSDHLTIPIRRKDIRYRVNIARRCLEAALPSLHLWNDVVLWASTHDFALPILSVLGHASAPNITALMLSSSSFRNTLRAHSLFSTPPPIFANNLPRLIVLRLVDATLPWGSTAYFAGLRRLHLGSLNWLMWPTAPQLANTLAIASNLRALVLGGFGIKSAGIFAISDFSMPLLESLTLYCTPQLYMLITVLRRSQMPALRDLNLHNFDRPGWDNLFTMDIFEQLNEVVVEGGDINDEHVLQFFSSLRDVTFLQLASTHTYYFDILALHPHLCPSLKHLCISSISLADAATYLIARNHTTTSSRIKIFDLKHNHSFPLTYEEYIDALCVVDEVEEFYTDPHIIIGHPPSRSASPE
ncbi:hypothetical protein C8R43DRAFT_940797 [Mycena crocata]|nr:hypothetical protein C8R43DRAFT_940797 [Mycena crocata]